MLIDAGFIGAPVVLPEMVFTIDTTLGDATPTFAIPLVATSTSTNFEVDWGDSNVETITGFGDPRLDHTYAVGGTYTVTIRSNDLNGFSFSNGGDKDKLTTITQWGGFDSANTTQHFRACTNLVGITATDAPKFHNEPISFLRSCTGLTTLDISNWDFSPIDNASSMFRGMTNLVTLNGHETRDMSNVLNLSFMFSGNAAWVGANPSGWTIAQVTDIRNAFNLVTLATPDYDSTLINWAAQTVQPNLTLVTFGGSQYTVATAQSARDTLTNAPNNWAITDGGGI